MRRRRNVFGFFFIIIFNARFISFGWQCKINPGPSRCRLAMFLPGVAVTAITAADDAGLLREVSGAGVGDGGLIGGHNGYKGDIVSYCVLT